MSCFHCGLAIPPGSFFTWDAGAVARHFCCPGCEAISRSINERGLDDYYRLRERPAARPVERESGHDLVLYDDPGVQSGFVKDTGSGGREAALLLEGLRCAACAWLAEKAVRSLPGVTAFEVNYSTRRARLAWDGTRLKLSAVLESIRDVGYAAWPFEEKRLAAILDRDRRAMLRRFCVAGLGMMQVMMYAVPAYLAGEGDITADIESLLRWAGLVLTLPVVAYSAAPFFLGAWRDLRLRRLGMDVPVALGIAVAFGASVVAVLAGRGAVYFDSVTMFVFLLLGGRYLELIARQKAGDALQRLARVAAQSAHRLVGEGLQTETIPALRLEPRDRVLVRPGETLPADGRLEAGEAIVSEALLTGESAPLRRSVGECLSAGSVNAGDAFVMSVTRAGADTTLATLERLMERALGERPRWVELAQRASAFFVGAILLAAVAAGLAWLAIDPARALWIAVSVLIVTCPCALSLAAPVVATVATGAAARGHFVVTRGHTLEALAGATDFVFDKTGTLTTGEAQLLEVVTLGSRPRDECLAIAAAAGQASAHPLDRALVKAATSLSLPPVEEHRSHSGHGIEAVVSGRRCRIGRASFVAALHGKPPPVAELDDSELIDGASRPRVWLGDEEGWIAAFSLGDRLRPEAKAAVDRIRSLGGTIHLLTGDEESVARRVAGELGIERVEARATPQHKLAYLRALQLAGARVAMVGDGINDAPVLAQADVSVAMGGGADLAQVRADAVLLSDSIMDLAGAVVLARRARAVMRQNIAWALAYNVIVIPLAFAGMVTPLIAGIGMSASSLVVVANALRLRR